MIIKTINKIRKCKILVTITSDWFIGTIMWWNNCMKHVIMQPWYVSMFSATQPPEHMAWHHIWHTPYISSASLLLSPLYLHYTLSCVGATVNCLSANHSVCSKLTVNQLAWLETKARYEIITSGDTRHYYWPGATGVSTEVWLLQAEDPVLYCYHCHTPLLTGNILYWVLQCCQSRWWWKHPSHPNHAVTIYNHTR